MPSMFPYFLCALFHSDAVTTYDDEDEGETPYVPTVLNPVQEARFHMAHDPILHTWYMQQLPGQVPEFSLPVLPCDFLLP